MKSLTAVPFVSLFVLTTVVLAESGGPSRSLLNFISTFTGLFSNHEQVWKDVAFKAEPRHDLAVLNIVAADIPDLRPNITVYLLETDFGKVMRTLVLVFTEDVEGSFIITPHNLTDPDRFGNTLPDLAEIALIKAEDLITPRKECVVAYHQAGDGVYIGTWPDCVHMVNGRFLSYGNTLTCESWSAVVNFGAIERGNRFPYVLRRIKSYPLPESWTEGVDGWTPPCGNV